MSRRSIAKREGRLQTNCSQSDFLTERQLLPKADADRRPSRVAGPLRKRTSRRNRRWSAS